jgi:hypothetical protein
MGHLGVLICFSYFLHFHLSALLGLPNGKHISEDFSGSQFASEPEATRVEHL